MNKIVLYVGLAILLGTVSMVAPLALLKDDNPFLDYNYTIKTSDSSLENQTRESYNNSDVLGLDSTVEDYSAIAPAEPEPTASEVSPEEPQTIVDVNSGDSTTDFSPVALITVPSFLIALGVFVLMRRQVS